ncbi:hypothetical protein L211DRAFT_839250 [Terfezia boudieri ATCC MYA-4762]|uniref:Uncharacterized protein n=1 Tax=Terfezia boudieri ATCC MYA-4762 TaxID=1051890 RepID=A0A3N4LXW5_9PEZI|nr:hypothetical protein L211DRAFT_839250 [Terfezia boudieri ATCC MYA-4762]
MTDPTPSHYTLLLKSHRTTVLLSALPETPLTELKDLLFTALTASSPHHITSPLPATAHALVLGLPRNPSDWSRGWYPIGEDADMDIDAIDVGVEGVVIAPNDDDAAAADAGDGFSGKIGRGGRKGKEKKKGKKAGLEWTVEKAGLKDGSVVAYYVRGEEGEEEGFSVEVPVEDEEEEQEEEEEWEEGQGRWGQVEMER